MFYKNFLGFSNHRIRLFFITILFITLYGISVSARQVTLTWDPNSEPDLSHYIVYWGVTSGNYTSNSGSIGLVTEYTATIPDAGQYFFAVTAVDDAGLESDYSNEVNTENGSGSLPPVANAGPDQTKTKGQIVTLNGSGSSDPDGSIITYQWTQTGGTAVTLSNAKVAQPTFTAPNVVQAGAALTFRLTVTDPQGLQSSDTVIINVTGVNTAPLAKAGADQTKAEGQVVTLNGSGSSDPDGSTITYQWAQTVGTAVTLSNAKIAQPTFTAPNVVQAGAALTFRLTVTDSQGLQSSDSVIVNVTWVNAAPVAKAGADQTKAEGLVVTLNGSGSSDPDYSPVTYQWTQTVGTSVTLSNAKVVLPTFTAPNVDQVGATLTFRLTVTDPQGLQSSDTVIINITWVNTDPIANAGPDQNMEEGLVILNGSNSIDLDGTINAWQWNQTSGTPVTLSSSNSAQSTFTAPNVNPEGETLTFDLTVTDSQGLKSTDSSIINITWLDDPPIADAGDDQNMEEGQAVTLYGLDSIDPEGVISSWQWTQTSGIPVTLSSATVAQPTFTAPDVKPAGESLTFELIVTDSHGLMSSDSCIVNVLWVNDPPIANAGSNQNVISGKLVTLNGSGSVDNDGYIISYMWRQISGTPVTFNNPAIAKPTFTPSISSQSETLVFQLVVIDNGGLKSSSECTVKVTKVTSTIPL